MAGCSAAGKYYLHSLFAVKLKNIQAGPRLHIDNLCHTTVSVYSRDIVCVLAETVSWGDRAKVCCSDDVGCGSNGGSLDDGSRYLTKCGRLIPVLGAVSGCGSTQPASCICGPACPSGSICLTVSSA